jgi:acyl-ACP thioesterase
MKPCTVFGRLDSQNGLPQLLRLSQEAAFAHLKELGLNGKAEEQGLAWMIIRIHGEILRPVAGDVAATTWPMAGKLGFLPRYCEMRDLEGNLCARLTSMWVLADADARTLRTDEPIPVPDMTRGDELPVGRSLPKKNLPYLGDFSVLDSQIDENGHMNNCEYATLAMPYFPPRPLKEFTIDYRAELLPRAQGNLWGAMDGDNLFISGMVDEKEHFRMKFTFQEEVAQ